MDSSLNFIYKSKLFKQLIGIIVILIILAIGIPGAFTLFYMTPHLVKERYHQVMLNDVDFLAARLDWNLKKSLNDVDYLSRKIGLSTPQRLKEAGEAIEIFVKGSSIFTGGALTDLQGIVQLFYTSPQGLVELRQTSNISYRDYIQAPLKTNRIYLSDVVLTKTSDASPVIFVSNVVIEGGQTSGVLAMSINLWNSNNIFNSLFQGFQNNKQGNLYVVDGHGTIVYHKDKEMVGKTVAEREILSYIYAQKEGIVDSISTKIGDVCVAFGKLDTNNWVVVYEIPHKDIYAMSRVNMDMTIGTMLLVIALGLLVSVIFAQLIIKPLEEITLATEQVAAGDLNRQINFKGHPDFQRVIQNFNIMTSNLKVQYKELEKLSLKDYLTGLANRRYFEQQFNLELDRACRLEHPSTLLMLDVDNFKIINDKFGHLEGDKALKALAKVLRDSVREMDLPVRFGGEEFLVMLPETSLERGRIVAEKIRERISEIKIISRKGNIMFTVSIGMTSTEQLEGFDGSSLESAGLSLLKQADEALYLAKSKGKNRVETYQLS
ncbi:sensor domain-containing diguanylate cyclase [Desulfosporosinus meridiei]|uniref:Diguanylate cyclase (GGDEF) domain-containing protein n=1 Tax=Desulfosporosinus meridiei (strain ATCC BAA-275 / DSM 13257 / KCTC 12902 / NCIMB 13706 / S10) TaxID=768704 RepID=J7IWK5_DESMD|nr:diguanylate cyclase [Desulfosporosinus meridiei]AFQ44534.1 diguanylate cyclase (GGDEF) domain-containing protein [Desulfosporosinus meridiei DSM 13257]